MRVLLVLLGYFLRIALRQNSIKLWFPISAVLTLTANRLRYFEFDNASISPEILLSEYWMAGGALTIAFFHLISRDVARGRIFNVSSRPVYASIFYFSRLLAAGALNFMLGAFLLLVYWVDSEVMAKPIGGGLNNGVVIGILGFLSLVTFSSYCSLVASLSSKFWSLVLMVGGFLVGQIGGTPIALEGFGGGFELLYCFIPDTAFMHAPVTPAHAGVILGSPFFLQFVYFANLLAVLSVISITSYQRYGFMVRSRSKILRTAVLNR